MAAKKKSPLAIAFRIVYNAIYAFLYLVLTALLLSLPTDIVRQAVIRNQTFNILVIAIAYIVTIVVLIFVYAIRLYINRSVLASIPKSYLPIEKGDLKKDVRKMIVAGLSRSAAIAYVARPRVAPNFPTQLLDSGGEKAEVGLSQMERRSIPPFKLKKTVTAEDEMGISLPPCKPVWGEIEHPGWGSPMSPDLPDLQYASVISELPNLIEAKAITLAPQDPESHTDPPMLDPEAVALLQRTEEMTLRDYLAHLADIGVLDASQAKTTTSFVAKYEYARFSTRPLTNIRFRELMHLFAEVLRALKPLDPAALASIVDPDSGDEAPPESDIDNNAPRTPRGNRTPESSIARSASSSTGSSGSLRPRGTPSHPTLGARNSSAHTWQQSFRTAPTTPKSRRTAVSSSSSSGNSFVQTRKPYPASQASSASLRSDSGSVIIRLAGEGEGDLPYVLNLTDTRSSAG